MSSFSGKIKEYPQISVDRFDGRHLASTAYFLSHHHSDHMHGLSSPQFLDHLESNSGVYLYCSPISAKLLQTNIRYRPLSPFIRPLQIEESVKITIPNIAEDAGQHLWVILIPAAHCPGSVMFLYEGRGGTVLYTGDFRLSIGEASRIGPLHTAEGTVKTIDHLHIDTTFCHKDIMKFPSREESLTALLELVEDWLARGNNYLIHLVCPAKYGYEFVYRGIHDRFGMKIHVSHWKYRMYASVPEILAILTSDATETWIHACDGNTKENDNIDGSGPKQLPCHCVPYGVDIEPNIRVIRPSAMYFAVYQSVKEIKRVNSSGSFCRVLLSMHASCSEILDLVSYLRPRKVSPNVIPFNSTREEVLKLLHEALNRSGDHYSIEYVSNQGRSLGSFKRQLDVSDSSSNSCSASNSMLEAGMLDSFMSSPSKKRRHSDSNMTQLLPTPRGNIKGSLSLEGEARHDGVDEGAAPEYEEPPASSKDTLVWMDPYSQSPSQCDAVDVSIAVLEDDRVGRRNSRPHSRYSSTATDGGEPAAVGNGALAIQESQESVDLGSVFEGELDPAEGAAAEDAITRPSSSNGVAGESRLKRSRRLWYKHKHFSTPVHEDTDGQASRNKVPRSSSLPLPDHLCLEEEDQRDTSEVAAVDSECDSGEPSLPLITISCPFERDTCSRVCDPPKEDLSVDQLGQQLELECHPESTPESRISEGSTVVANRYDLTQGRMSTVAISTFDSDDFTSADTNDRGMFGGRPRDSNYPSIFSHDRSAADVSTGSCSDIEEIYSSVSSETRPSVIRAPLLKKDQLAESNGKWIDCELPKLKHKYHRASPHCGRGVKRKLVELSEKRSLVGGDSDLSAGQPIELADACARSSCLKTAKRSRDQIQVFSLDRSPL